MAYGNYGGNAFCNGKRMTNHEDQTPYREEELEAGYWQAFGRNVETNTHHVTLGKGAVRLCAYKTSPTLFVNGPAISMDRFITSKDEDGYADEWEGEILGCKFTANFNGENRIDLWLQEPDGTVWNGFSGYAMGAGWED